MKCALLVFSIIFFVLGFGPMGQASSSKARILPFKVWKQKKIDEAKTVVSELKHHKSQIKTETSEDDEKQDAAQQLSQAELNLGVARELSANDYFLLYVSPQFKNNNDALVQAARALSPRDMADILVAYQKRLQTPDISNNAGTPETPAAENDAGTSEKTAKSP
jgi:hypothetical protein